MFTQVIAFFIVTDGYVDERVVGDVDIVFVKSLGEQEGMASLHFSRQSGAVDGVEQGKRAVGMLLHEPLGSVKCGSLGVAWATPRKQQRNS